MGRYAYFSTGIEYKFAFAVQDSDDILKYGGYRSLENQNCLVWIAEYDLPKLEKRLNLLTLNISEYEKTEAGYQKFIIVVSDQLREKFGIKDSYFDLLNIPKKDKCQLVEYYSYILGYSIYFQLHMSPILSVEYED